MQYIFGHKYMTQKYSVRRCEELLYNARRMLHISSIEMAHGVIIFIRYRKSKNGRIRYTYAHNLLCVALMLSNKILRDVPYKNTVWAKLIHVPLLYFNLLELRFLRDTQFNIIASVSEFRKIWKRLFADV